MPETSAPSTSSTNGTPSPVPPRWSQWFTTHTKELVERLTEWFSLKLELKQLELQEAIESRINKVVLGIILAVFGFLVAVFGLTAAALGIGTWLGHPAWGFLVVTGLLLLVMLVLALVKPDFAAMGRSAPEPPTALPEGTPNIPSERRLPSTHQPS